MIILRQKIYGERWDDFKHKASHTTKGALKGAIAGSIGGAAIGVEALKEGMSPKETIGLSTAIGAGIGAIGGGLLGYKWRGESPAEKKEREEKKRKINSTIPKWFKDGVKKFNDKVESLTLDLMDINRDLASVFIPRIIDWLEPVTEDKIIIAIWDGYNPDNHYCELIKQDVIFLLDLKTKKISMEINDGKEISVNSFSDIRRHMNLVPLDRKKFDLMMGKDWKDWYEISDDVVDEFISKFNNQLKHL